MKERLGPFRVEYLISQNPVAKGKVANLLNPPHKFTVPVAGISFRQDDVRAALRMGSKGMAYLIYENENPHDSNAVAVWVRERHVGYIPRDLNVEFRQAMAPCIPSGTLSIPLRCPMVIIGGGVDRSYGIRLDLPRSFKAAEEKKRKATVKKTNRRVRLSEVQHSDLVEKRIDYVRTE